MAQTQSSYAQRVRLLVDSICGEEGTNRRRLAESLGIHPVNLGDAAYQAKIGFDLLHRLCLRAGWDEASISELELLYLDAKASKPRGDAVGQAMRIVEALLAELSEVETFLEKKELLGEFRKGRRPVGRRRAQPRLRRARVPQIRNARRQLR